jgi:signal transduction histidine kinase
MKSSITTRLILYFSSVVVAFALILVIVFSFVAQRQTQQEIQTSLQQTSIELKEVLEESQGISIARDRLENILRSIELSDVQAWIVFADGRINLLSQTRMGMMRERLEITEKTQDLIDQVFSGESILSESLSGVFDQETTTVGVPIEINQQVTAALFISASNQAIANLNRTSLNVLRISLGIGLLLAITLGYFLSLHFVKPLKQANQAIDALALGQYDTKLVVTGKDEISQLSLNINTLAERLHQAQQQSQQLERMRESFIADITHELRTPVTIIRGLMESVQDGLIEADDVPQMASQILSETKGMQRLIQDLLDLSKLEDPSFKMMKDAVDLNIVLQDVQRSALALATHKDLSLSFEYPHIPHIFMADAQRLKQMWMIVLDNAIKFSPAQGVIRVGGQLEHNEFTLIISDQGPGMAEAQLKEVFERYKTSNQAGGNGLGLLIASKIAAAHDIDLRIESQLNQGTQVIFKLRFKSTN